MAKELEKVDVVTVGVGWTGGIVAAECAKEGLKVVGLERGRERGVDDYFMIHDELRYAIRYDLMQDLSKETITFRNEPKQRALPMRRLGSFLPGEGLGGAGVHWNGMTFRFLPYDFEIYSQTVDKYGKDKIKKDYTVQDWGITYDELEPYFDKFEKTCGISGEEWKYSGKRSNPYPTPPMKNTPYLNRFAEAAKELGYEPFMAPSANLSETYENPDGMTINACQYCGFCERFGCEYGAKSDPTITVIPTAQKTGNFELRPHSNVTDILHDGEKATGVKYVDVLSGEEYIQPAEVVVLTSYTMNNTRLLLHSKLGRPYDPDSGTGVIGKNYCYQIMVGVTGFYEDEQFNTFMGAGALAQAIDDLNGDNFDHSDLDFIHGGVLTCGQSGRRPIAYNPTPPGTPGWGAEFKKNSIKYYTQTISIGFQGASIPYRYNYLDLDPTYKDAYGSPLLRMTYNFTDQDRQLFKYLSEKGGEIMEAMGADTVARQEELGDYDIRPYQSTHNTGGAIMGDDPDTSAVNNYLQMWDADNVFVVGASAFAHNGGYNPTGTVGALAYRAAEGIVKYSKNGGQLV
ncbi:GMC family oxidoreductase [Novibacillus thermophilus]|uniref:GMC family oxidoreductase n=1 Tax=Novibacillus thermophilus TaxID=1471761 RepID=A0A1U9K879_9BACL|nr:GMC family oxidoreductase [Novibacillus thermophilus]AQS56242.1 GMC family oxidoreductase [Novibacillus thermophilus]